MQQTTTDTVLSEKRDGKLTITLNRPEAINALTIEMIRRLHELFDETEDDDDVKVVVLQAAGERGFSAGLDTKRLAVIREEGGKTYKQLFKLLYGLCKKIDAFPKLVVSVVNGHCIAAGAQIATAADIVIAGEGLKLLENEMRSGGFNDDSWAKRLSRTIGPVRAKAYVFLMEPLSGREALAMGLVSKVVPDADLASYAEAMTTQMAGYNEGSVRKTLQLIDEAASE